MGVARGPADATHAVEWKRACGLGNTARAGEGDRWGDSERCCWAGDPLSPYAVRDPPTVTPRSLGSHTHATQSLWCPCPKEQWPRSGLC